MGKYKMSKSTKLIIFIALFCSPFAAIAAGAFVASGIASAFGGAKQAKANRRAIKYERRALKREAQNVLKVSQDEAARFQDQGEAFQGTQKQQLGMSGVDLEGSPLMVLNETAANLEKDRQRIIDQGEYDAQTLMNKRKALKKAGAAADVGSNWAIAGSLFSGGANAISAYNAIK